jgi:DNA-directed RNA polymerase subunit omega
MLHKRDQFDSTEVMHRAEELMSAASNRYRITVQVANRAKRRRYEDFENIDDPMMKPVIRAIVEMSDELTQPEIIGEDFTQFEKFNHEPEPWRSLASKSEIRKNGKVKESLEVDSRSLKEAEKEAVEDIHALMSFFEDQRRAIENKSTKDIQTLVKLVEDAEKSITASIKYLAESLTYTKEQACQLLNHATDVSGQVLASLKKTIIDWNPEWVDILLKAMTDEADLDKAKDEVKKLQLAYPHEQPIQIANRIIWNKTLATLTSTTALDVIDAIKEIASTTIEKLALETLALFIPIPEANTILVEMVYQIAVAYGFDNLENPEQKGDFLTIFAIALGSQQIRDLGLNFLGKQTPIHGLLIDATTNVLLFQLLGYVASQFYEAKVKAISPLTSIKDYTTLEEKVKAYLQKAISQKEAIHEIVADAVSIQEQLVLT